MRLTLHFTSSPALSLNEISFQTPLLGERLSCRGKGLTFTAGLGSFQWSAAVKAFAQLVVGTRLAVARATAGRFILASRGSGPAASLDYALSKPTAWVVDLFGTRSDARAAVRYVFRVVNSGQKLPGAVEITLSDRLYEEHAVHIKVDGSAIGAAGELEGLLRRLGGVVAFDRLTVRASRKARPWYEGELFSEALLREFTTAVRESELLEPLGIEQAAARMRSRPWFKSAGRGARAARALTASLPAPHERYASPRTLPFGKRPVRVACLPMAVGAAGLLLQVQKRFVPRLSLLLHYPSTSSMLEGLPGERLEFAVLSWGALLKWPRKIPVAPLMLLPRTGFQLVVPAPDRERLGAVYLAKDPVGYPMQFFTMLKEREPGYLKGCKVHDATIAEVSTHLKNRDGGGVVAFPYPTLLASETGCTVSTRGASLPRFGDNILVQIGAPSSVGAALIRALRTVWFELLEDRGAIEGTARALFEEHTFRTALHRLGGLHAEM